MPTLSINHQGLSRLRRQVRPDLPDGASDRELAKRIGIDQSTMHRVLAGKADPGAKFVAGVLKEFGYRRFCEVFQVVDD